MKVLLYIVVGVGTVYLASIVTPDDLKSRVMAAVGLQEFSLTNTITNTASDIKDKIIPQSPTEKRASMIERMEQSLADIKKAQEDVQISSNPVEYVEVVSDTRETIKETEALLKELKEENEKSKDGAFTAVAKSVAGAIDAVAGMISGSDEEEASQECTP